MTTSEATMFLLLTPVTDTVVAGPEGNKHPELPYSGWKSVYVVNTSEYPEFRGTVSVIDTATNNVTATISVGCIPCGVAVNPMGTKVYVANSGGNTTSIIDTATNTVTATIPVGVGPEKIAFSPDGKKVYVTNQGDVGIPGNVFVIDTSTNQVIDTVPVGDNLNAIATVPIGS